MESETLKFKVYIEEIQTCIMWKGGIEVSSETHPELAGKTQEEVIDYIKKNSENMPPIDKDTYDSLYDELQDSEPLKTKYIPQSDDITIEIIK